MANLNKFIEHTLLKQDAVYDDFIKLFKAIPKVDAGLAASIFHFGEVDIKDLKEKLKDNGINVRI